MLVVVISPRQSLLSFESEEGRRFEIGINAIVQCANKIHASM
jgi:hypothetical protein